MQVVICYDTGNDKLRYRLVKYLERMAVRIHGDVEKAQIEKLQQFAEILFQSYKDDSASLLVFPIRDCDWKNKPNLSADCLYI